MESTPIDIKIISWPDPIRKRPEMYLRSLGKEGCCYLLEQVLISIFDDKYQCCAESCNVVLTNPSGIIISYDGMGMPIDTEAADIPQPIIYRSMMTLFGGRESDCHYKKYGHLATVGPVLNAVCRTLRLTTNVNERAYSVSFRNGCISSLLQECPITELGNSLQFEFDSGVLGNTKLSTNDARIIVDYINSCYEHKNIAVS
jgi:DNA gyrase/topoisomerase IV subunit B